MATLATLASKPMGSEFAPLRGSAADVGDVADVGGASDVGDVGPNIERAVWFVPSL